MYEYSGVELASEVAGEGASLLEHKARKFSNLHWKTRGGEIASCHTSELTPGNDRTAPIRGYRPRISGWNQQKGAAARNRCPLDLKRTLLGSSVIAVRVPAAGTLRPRRITMLKVCWAGF